MHLKQVLYIYGSVQSNWMINIMVYFYSKVIAFCLLVCTIQKDHAKKFKWNILAKIRSLSIIIYESVANTLYLSCGVTHIFLDHHLPLKYQANDEFQSHVQLSLCCASFQIWILNISVSQPMLFKSKFDNECETVKRHSW